MNVLRVKNLCKNQILHNVSFLIKEGEMVAIMGPSGSGKSTLLYHVAGMDNPTKGEVWLGQEEITALTEDEKAKMRLHRMGFIFQQMNMMSHLNLIDNILLPAVQANKEKKFSKGKQSKEKMMEQAKNLMKKLSISELEERKITQVSGGQLQRACICRSMMNQPEILLADEPTGALNRGAAAEVMDEMVALNSGGTTILMVTHDSRVASRCHRILYLVDGSICGELVLGREENETDKQREERVNLWIMEQDAPASRHTCHELEQD